MQGKHGKNNNSIIIAIIVIGLIALITISIFKIKDSEKQVYNENNTNVEENETINNEIQENVSEIEDEIQDENENTNIVDDPNEQVTVTPEEDPEEKAINIVKNDWGDGAVVYFNCVGRDEKGRYIVVIADAETTRAIQWYYVDLTTGEFEIVNN